MRHLSWSNHISNIWQPLHLKQIPTSLKLSVNAGLVLMTCTLLLRSIFPSFLKIWKLKLKKKLFPNLTSYVFCILKAKICLLPSKWHYFQSWLITNVCYEIDIFCSSILNGFLTIFAITYSLKLVSFWVSILCILQIRLF